MCAVGNIASVQGRSLFSSEMRIGTGSVPTICGGYRWACRDTQVPLGDPTFGWQERLWRLKPFDMHAGCVAAVQGCTRMRTCTAGLR